MSRHEFATLKLRDEPRESHNNIARVVFILQFFAAFGVSVYLFANAMSLSELDDLFKECTDIDAIATTSSVIDQFAAYSGAITGALFGALTLSIGWIFWLRSYAKCVVWFTVLVPCVMMLTSAIYMASYEEYETALYFIAALTIMLIFSYCWRHKLNLSASMISVASHSLLENPGIVGTAALLSLTILAYLLFTISAIMAPTGTVNAQCQYTEEKTASNLKLFLGFSFLWTLSTLECIQLFAVSSSVATWYFREEQAQQPAPKHPTLFALKHAFTTALGTVAIGGLIMAIADYLQRKARSRGRGIFSCLYCCIRALASCMKMVSRMSVIMAALTNQSFYDATRTGFNVIQRSFVDGIVADTIGRRIMVTCAWAISLVLGGVVWGLVGDGDVMYDQTGLAFAILGSMTFVLWRYFGLLIILMFSESLTELVGPGLVIGTLVAIFAFFVADAMGHTVIYAVDTVFVCYCIDSDMGGHSSVSGEISDLVAEYDGYNVPGGSIHYADLEGGAQYPNVNKPQPAYAAPPATAPHGAYPNTSGYVQPQANTMNNNGFAPVRASAPPY